VKVSVLLVTMTITFLLYFKVYGFSFKCKLWVFLFKQNRLLTFKSVKYV